MERTSRLKRLQEGWEIEYILNAIKKQDGLAAAPDGTADELRTASRGLLIEYASSPHE